jgi:DNA-binding transcriptional MerR regulator
MKTPSRSLEKLLTRLQVAALFGVTKHTVRMYERRGLLSALRINHRVVRYDPADVQRLLASSRT